MAKSDYLVIHRADFLSYTRALCNFPDWEKIVEWIDEHALDETTEITARLDRCLAMLQDMAPKIEKAAEVGDVFSQFGSMMGYGEQPAEPGDAVTPGHPQINMLGQ